MNDQHYAFHADLSRLENWLSSSRAPVAVREDDDSYGKKRCACFRHDLNRFAEIDAALRNDSSRMVFKSEARQQNIAELQKLSSHFSECFARADETAYARLASLKRSHPDSPLFLRSTYFEPLSMGNREVAQTRALAWLLNPKSGHGYGTLLLTALLRGAGPLLGTETISSSVKVRPEYQITKNARADIYVSGKISDHESESDFLLIVEAKISASEGEDQLQKYTDYMLRQNIKKSLGIFLCPDGRKPESLGRHAIGASLITWISMTYTRLASLMMGVLIEEDSSEYPRSEALRGGRDILRLYIAGILKDIQGHSLPIDDPLAPRRPYLISTLIEEIEC